MIVRVINCAVRVGVAVILVSVALGICNVRDGSGVLLGSAVAVAVRVKVTLAVNVGDRYGATFIVAVDGNAVLVLR
jgi:hypothetical protein